MNDDNRPLEGIFKFARIIKRSSGWYLQCICEVMPNSLEPTRLCAVCGKVKVTIHHCVCSGCRCRAAYAAGNPRYKCPRCGGFKSNHTHQCLACYQAMHEKPSDSPSVP